MKTLKLSLVSAIAVLGFAGAAAAETICSADGCFEHELGPNSVISLRGKCGGGSYLTVRDGLKICVQRSGGSVVPFVVGAKCTNGTYLTVRGDLKVCAAYNK